MSKKQRKGVPPVVAVLMLVVGGAVAGNALLDLGSSPAPVPFDPMGDDFDDEDGLNDVLAGADAANWEDLLARHGSYAIGMPVRMAVTELALQAIAPTPLAETGGPSVGWRGTEPPQLQLGVVMLSDRADRAVLGGQVVGTGEEIQGFAVERIERGAVVGIWRGRVLTYDFENAWPREFRSELERRRAAELAASAAAADVVAAPAMATAIDGDTGRGEK